MRYLAATIALLALAALEPAHAQSVDVIVHPDVQVETIARVELSRIFLKRLLTWEDHTPVVPVDQVPHSEVRADFTRLVHRRSVVNVEVYWKRLIFSGRAVPPPEMAGDEDVIAFVRSTPGAVGYVRSAEGVEGVRRVEVLE